MWNNVLIKLEGASIGRAASMKVFHDSRLYNRIAIHTTIFIIIFLYPHVLSRQNNKNVY